MKSNNKLNKRYNLVLYNSDLIWGGVAIPAVFVICLELFYRMIVNYKHHYPSDYHYYAVENIGTNEDHGRLIGTVYKYLYGINEDIMEIAIFAAIVIVGIIIANYLTMRFFVREDGYIDMIPRYSMQFFSIASLFAGPIYVPFFFERYYKHTFKSFAWHSPTQQAMTLFAILASICFLKMYINYQEQGVNPWWWIATALTTFLSATAKPSFAISMSAAVVVMFLIDLIKGGSIDIGKRFVRLVVMGCSLIPSGLYIIWMHTACFTEGTQFGEEHAVIIDFAHVLDYDNLLGAIIFGMAIPIVVFALNSERFKDQKYRFSIYIFLMGMVQWILFDETGRRANYGNFTWGRTYGIYYLTLTASIVFLETYYDKEGKFDGNKRKRAAYLIIVGLIIAASILSQLNYFRLILTGHGYQL